MIGNELLDERRTPLLELYILLPLPFFHFRNYIAYHGQLKRPTEDVEDTPV